MTKKQKQQAKKFAKDNYNAIIEEWIAETDDYDEYVCKLVVEDLVESLNSIFESYQDISKKYFDLVEKLEKIVKEESE